jgi:hypothetical protein
VCQGVSSEAVLLPLLRFLSFFLFLATLYPSLLASFFPRLLQWGRPLEAENLRFLGGTEGYRCIERGKTRLYLIFKESKGSHDGLCWAEVAEFAHSDPFGAIDYYNTSFVKLLDIIFCGFW